MYCMHVAAVLTNNQTYNNLGLYDSVADSQMLLLNNQSIVQLEVATCTLPRAADSLRPQDATQCLKLCVAPNISQS